MSFGTLGVPDVVVSDFNNTTKTGSPTVIDDTKGGLAGVSDGAGGRYSIDHPISLNDDSFTYAYIFNYPSVAAAAAYIHKAAPGGTGFESYLNTSGQPLPSIFSDFGAETIPAQGPARDDETIYIFIHTARLNTAATDDHDHYYYMGPLDSTLTQYTRTPNDNDISFFRDPTDDFYFLAANDGSFPAPTGAWVGQFRYWTEKYCDLTDAGAIQTEYQNLGAESSDDFGIIPQALPSMCSLPMDKIY